ncbi:DUF3562 domain-containing protein [Paraburkholderia acidiphila]
MAARELAATAQAFCLAVAVFRCFSLESLKTRGLRERAGKAQTDPPVDTAATISPDRRIQLESRAGISLNSNPACQPLLADRSQVMTKTADVAEIVHTIAEETNTPEETVARIYADTLNEYRAQARIQDYLPLFAARKTRATLRQNGTKH